jgi:hypothetical protein
MSYDVIRFIKDGITWRVEDPLPLDDTPLRVEAPYVHYYRLNEEGRLAYDSSAFHSFTLISPELEDTLVGTDQFAIILEVATTVPRASDRAARLRNDPGSFVDGLQAAVLRLLD